MPPVSESVNGTAQIFLPSLTVSHLNRSSGSSESELILSRRSARLLSMHAFLDAAVFGFLSAVMYGLCSVTLAKWNLLVRDRRCTLSHS